MNEIFIYTPKINARISYVFDLIFNQFLGISTVSLTSDLYAFNARNDVAKINYSRSFMSDIPYFFPNSLLLETGIRALHPIFKKEDALMAAFFHVPAPNNQHSSFPFDPFALTFYLVSRYEEYLDFSADQFGRFSASNSVAYKNGFLQQPLVNLWALKIKALLEKKYPSLQFNCPQYQYTPSYDIDHAYAFLQKGWLRQSAAFGKNIAKLDVETLSLQVKTWLRIQKDPYDCFSYLESLDDKYQLKPIYFWLLGDYGTHDKNIHYNNKHFRQLIQKNAQKYPIGIHPSFGSNQAQDLVDKEIHRLRKITTQSIRKSRQHFLILALPKTYERLINLGIQEDYSMGYAQQVGFRASVAQPFYWYNLKTEQKTSLQVFPFQLMDVTFNTYLKQAPEAILEQAGPVIQNTKAVGGHLISIWHNSSLCEAWQWKGWREAYE
ncbi:MAG: Unknown protein, partial [uncultured Aureispira sp.]